MSFSIVCNWLIEATALMSTPRLPSARMSCSACVQLAAEAQFLGPVKLMRGLVVASGGAQPINSMAS